MRSLPPLTCLLVFVAGCHAVEHDVEVPEPMVFDLVRGLGAEQGELEVNALTILPLSSDDPAAPEIAPEIEYAVWDGFALELELPFEDHGLYSIKTAAQWTFGQSPEHGFIHGTQVIVERVLEVDAWETSLIYLPGFRFDERWAMQGMLGLRSLNGTDVPDDLGILANATLFYELDPRWTLGLETDSILLSENGNSVLMMPQAHWDISHLFTLQFGAGVLYLDGTITGGSDLLVPDTHGWFPQAALRLVLEF